MSNSRIADSRLGHYREVQAILPWATQTYSKRPLPELLDDTPLFCTRAKGATFWDSEGRAFTDYFCACGPIILGYADERVDSAVRCEMENGFLFSVASEKEYALAKRITGLFASIDWVKYMKTGGDAMTAAVRLARVYTQKYTVLQCGFHGWQDWYQCVSLGAGRERGIPEENLKYTISFPYGDIGALEELMQKTPDIAAVVIAPYDWVTELTPEYFVRLRELCDEHGALLIFDEIKCGFRVGLLGVQGAANVRPDITVFAKAISNGYPLAVLGGGAGLIGCFDKDCVVTTTYAGETLSMAAAMATLDVLEQGHVYTHLSRLGDILTSGIKDIASRKGLPLEALGKDSTITLRPGFGSHEENYAFSMALMRAHLRSGQFVKGFTDITYMMCDAHSEEDVARLLETIDGAV